MRKFSHPMRLTVCVMVVIKNGNGFSDKKHCPSLCETHKSEDVPAERWCVNNDNIPPTPQL